MIISRETFIKLLNEHYTPKISLEIIRLYCLYKGKDEKEINNFIKLLSIYLPMIDFPGIYHTAKEYLMTEYSVNILYKDNNPILYY